eukprot:scaffold207735_cov19-Tisochrysis_lutea.AAC.1
MGTEGQKWPSRPGKMSLGAGLLGVCEREANTGLKVAWMSTGSHDDAPIRRCTNTMMHQYDDAPIR